MKGDVKMANKDIRLLAKASGIKLWQIADELSITDNMLSRKLRYELNPREKENINSIIEKLKVSE